MTSDSVDITIVVDNNAGPGLIGEHGLSFWVEAGGRRIIFDTGQGTALLPNAKKLGIDLASADVMVLSHGHFDHTGGIVHVLQSNPGLQVYCHPGVVQPRYSIRNGQARSIHMPRSAMAAIDKVPYLQMHWLSRPETIGEAMGLSGPIPRSTDYEDTGGPFYLDPMGKRPDPIEDDLAMWIKTPKGLIICLGCCHAGLINTLRYIRRITGTDTVAAIIGGLHLLAASDRRIAATIDELRQIMPQTIIPCHCTGETAVEALLEAFPDRVTQGFAGMRLSF